MPTLAPGKPFTAKDPQLLVENKLTPGRYRFRLTVVDDSGNESDPADLIVTILEVRRPAGPVIRPDLRETVLRTRPGIAEMIRTRRPQ